MNPHWYLIYTRECPMCGRTKTERIRQYTPKPENPMDRYEYVQQWDYCQ